MKKLILLLAGPVALLSCNRNDAAEGAAANSFRDSGRIVALSAEPSQFHIRGRSDGYHSWIAEFTNDSFEHFETFVEGRVNNFEHGSPVAVAPKLFEGVESMRNFGMRFDSYEQCLAYNDSVRIAFAQFEKDWAARHPGPMPGNEEEVRVK